MNGISISDVIVLHHPNDVIHVLGSMMDCNNENGEEFTYITVEPLHSPTPQNDDPSLVTASIEAESTNFDKILNKNN